MTRSHHELACPPNDLLEMLHLDTLIAQSVVHHAEDPDVNWWNPTITGIRRMSRSSA